MKFKKIVIALLALSATTMAFAGNRPGAVTFSAGEAYYRFAPKRHFENNGLPNIALAYNVNDRFAVEGGVGLINTNIHNSTTLHGTLYTIDGLYRLSTYGHFEPYVSAGIGAIAMQSTFNAESQQQGNLNAGVGTQFFVDNSIALRGEVKDLYTIAGGKNDMMANFMMSFLFGG